MRASLRSKIRHAFAIPTPDTISAEDHQLMNRMATLIVKRGMGTPAILAIESSSPLSYLAAQLLHFFNPILTLYFNKEDYTRFATLLENRHAADVLVSAIEKAMKETP